MKPEPRKTPKSQCPNPDCKSNHTYHRKKTKDYVCQKCGNVWEGNDSG